MYQALELSKYQVPGTQRDQASDLIDALNLHDDITHPEVRALMSGLDQHFLFSIARDSAPNNEYDADYHANDNCQYWYDVSDVFLPDFREAFDALLQYADAEDAIQDEWDAETADEDDEDED